MQDTVQRDTKTATHKSIMSKKPSLKNGIDVHSSGPTLFPEMTAFPLRQAFESGRYPYPKLISTRSYEAQKAKLQAELLKVQIWAQEAG